MPLMTRAVGDLVVAAMGCGATSFAVGFTGAIVVFDGVAMTLTLFDTLRNSRGSPAATRSSSATLLKPAASSAAVPLNASV